MQTNPKKLIFSTKDGFFIFEKIFFQFKIGLALRSASDQDLSDETIRIWNFPSNRQLWYKKTFSVWVCITVLHEAFSNFSNRVPLSSSGKGAPGGGFNPPTVKFFIYRAILMKFEKQYFHMFTNNNWGINLLIGAPLPYGGTSPPLQKSQILYLSANFDEIWSMTFLYVHQW